MAVEFGFGFGLEFQALPTGVTFAAGDPMSLVVSDNTAIAGSAQYPGGWTARVTFKGNGLGVNTPDGSKITINTSTPSYAGGSPSTTARSIKATLGLRQVSPNHALFNVTATTDTVVIYALERRLHVGETITSVVIAAGAYGASNGGTLTAGVTNSSQLAYDKPVGNFVTLQDQEATGSTYRVEFAGTHWAARNGQQFDSIAFTATDESLNTVTATITQPTISTTITGANASGVYAETWAWDVPLAGLNQGERVYVRAQVKPWIGNASAILDSDPTADGFAWPGLNCTILCNLYFLNNKTGAYGTPYAYVNSSTGVDASGVVSTVAATARAAPFLTIKGAAAAIQTYCNANFARNNAGNGRIRLMDAANHVTFGATMAAIVAGKACLVIEDDPLNAGRAIYTSAVGSGASDAAKISCDALMFRGRITLQPPDAVVGSNVLIYGGTTAGSNKRLTIGPGINIPLQGVNTFVFRGVQWIQGLNFTCSNIGTSFFASSSTNKENWALIAGVIQTGTGGNIYPRNVIGSVFTGSRVSEPLNATNVDTMDGLLLMNCKLMACLSVNQFGFNLAYGRGAAVETVIFEGSEATGTIPCFQFGADGATFPITNINIWNCLMVGNRSNMFYNDDDTTINIVKTGSLGFNIIEQDNRKTDTFIRAGAPVASQATSAQRTGGWRTGRYAVDGLANTYIGPDYSGAIAGSPTAGLGDFLPPGYTFGETTSNAEATVETARQAMFNLSKAGPTLGGNGTYTYKSRTNIALQPAGACRNRYDLAGLAWLNNGTDPVGPYSAAAV